MYSKGISTSWHKWEAKVYSNKIFVAICSYAVSWVKSQSVSVARAGAVQGVVVLVGAHRGFSSQDIAGYEKVQHLTSRLCFTYWPSLTIFLTESTWFILNWHGYWNTAKYWWVVNISELQWNTLNICERGLISRHLRGQRSKTPAMESKWLKRWLWWMNCFETWLLIILCKFGQNGAVIGGCMIL